MAAVLPLVSVVIATGNRPATLRCALDCVARQSYENLEIVLVDDGSTREASRANQALAEQTARRFNYAYLDTSRSAGSGPSFV